MSQFLNHTDEYSAEQASGIDFDEAVKLPGGGSTCDIYKTRWHRRDVFVKRLKEEYRTMPLYLDAFDKEYDIGVTLKHPSLPDYRDFHRDYIVMDYIDGDTLAELIRRKDPWLSKEKNIIAMLRALVDVVDYLHRHNVVHCDIKPDNILITANNHNLVLIDFDKSYTDALSDTSGHPAKYGLTPEQKGRTAIDFHAMGLLAEKLKSSIPGYTFGGHKKFVKACYSADANCEDLKEILDATNISLHSRKRLNRLVIIVAVATIAVALMIGFGVYFFEKSDTPQPSPVKEADASTPTPTEKIVADPAPKTQADIHEEAKRRAEILDQRIKPAFDELQADLDRLNTLKNDTTLTGEQLLDNIRRHIDLADEYIIEASAILNESYPGLTNREEARIMSYSKAYTGYTRRATPELRELGKEIERRFKAEGRTPQ